MWSLNTAIQTKSVGRVIPTKMRLQWSIAVAAKTALVEGLAATLISKKPLDLLKQSQLLELRGADISSDCQTEADLNRRVICLFDFLSKHKSSILFLDRFDDLFPVHLTSDSTRALFSTILSDGNTPCIVTSTPKMWASVANKAPSLSRQFQVLQLTDPNKAQCREIADTWAIYLSKMHNIIFEPDVISATVEVAPGLTTDRATPDNIVDLLQNVITFVKVSAIMSDNERPLITSRDLESVLVEHYGVKQGRVTRQITNPQATPDM